MNNLQERRPRANRIGTLLGSVLAVTMLGLGLAAAARTTAPARGDDPLMSAPADDAGSALRHRRIRLPTGVELHVAEAGPSDGVPIVFLHGFTDSWFGWTRVLDQLPAGVRAIVPTQRGHGDSERPDCCYSVAAFAADVDATLTALDIDRAHVVAHSMGGVVAQRFAIDFPHRLHRLVIVNSSASLRNDAVIEFNDFVQQLTDPVDRTFIREFQMSTAAIPLPPTFLDGVISESAKLPARIWRDVLGAFLAPDAAHDLSRISAPTLIVWGEKDAFFPRSDQDFMAARISGASLLTYAEAGHAPNWEIPDVFVRDVVRFLGITP